MITKGLVTERSAYVRGGKQHRKVYFITTQGLADESLLQKGAQDLELATEGGNGNPHIDGPRSLTKKSRNRPNDSDSLEVTLKLAEEWEHKYDWIRAVDCYKRLPCLGPQGQIADTRRELLAYAVQRSCFQARTPEEFTHLINGTIAEYQHARDAYTKTSGLEDAWTIRCSATVAYLSYWLASRPDEKRKLLAETWELAKKCMNAFEAAGIPIEYARTYHRLSPSAFLEARYESNHRMYETRLGEAVKYGAQSIRLLSGQGEATELARAYAMTAGYLDTLGFHSGNQEEWKNYREKAEQYWIKAIALSEEAALIQMLTSQTGYCRWAEGSDKTLTHFERALEHALKARDRLLIGTAYDWLAYHYLTRSRTIQQRDEKADCIRNSLRCAEDAKRNYSVVSFISPRGGSVWIEAPHVECYYALACSGGESRINADLLKKSSTHITELLERAEASGIQDLVSYAHHAAGKTLLGLAKIEKDPKTKRRLLEKALAHRRKDIELVEQLHPSDFFSQGVSQNYLADIKSELSKLAEDPETKKLLLLEAIQIKDECIRLCNMQIQLLEGRIEPTLLAHIDRFRHEHGRLLDRLYELTGDNEHLKRAVNAFLP
jgi:hypothetical protein